MTKAVDHPILLFDGVCNLCTWSVQFIIERDAQAVFRFASLQSPAGQEHARRCNVALDAFEPFSWSKTVAVTRAATPRYGLRTISPARGDCWGCYAFSPAPYATASTTFSPAIVTASLAGAICA